MRAKLFSISLLLLFTLASAGCGMTGVQVVQVTPETSTYADHEVEIRNCSGEGDLQVPITEENAITKEVEVASEAIPVASGKNQPLSAETIAMFEQEVDQIYQPVYDEQKAAFEATNLTVPHWKVRTFKIFINEITYSSTISLRIDLQAYEVPYTYRLKVPYVNETADFECTA